MDFISVSTVHDEDRNDHTETMPWYHCFWGEHSIDKILLIYFDYDWIPRKETIDDDKLGIKKSFSKFPTEFAG